MSAKEADGLLARGAVLVDTRTEMEYKANASARMTSSRWTSLARSTRPGP
ncbi:hypothetical protein [Acidovorax sp. M2(2025)]